MSPKDKVFRSWAETLQAWLHPKSIAMLFLGFSAGIPILLIFSTLSLWLTEAGVTKSAVTFFSWAALGYSFKFVWAPLVDMLPLPFITKKFGRRRSWLLVAQLLIIFSICLMAYTDPASSTASLTQMALAAVLLGFSSATQDIVIDAYRIEAAVVEMQALLASMYIAGYRIGMLVAGAGALFLASYLGTSRELYNYSSWSLTYLAIAGVMAGCVAVTMVISEPEVEGSQVRYSYKPMEYVRFLLFFLLCVTGFVLSFFYSSPFIDAFIATLKEIPLLQATAAGFLGETLRFVLALSVGSVVGFILTKMALIDKEMAQVSYVAPIQEFFTRYGAKAALLLLLLVGFYRVSDIVLGVISNVFYMDSGFTKNEIAAVTKSFGLAMTIAGSFLGGLLTVRYGVMNILFLGALLSSVTNLLFMGLSQAGDNLTYLTFVICADNLSAGIAATAFIAFLSSLTNISFTASQYAIFSSIMTLFPKLIGGYSGTMVNAYGYEKFFLVTAIIGIPVLLLILVVKRVIWEQQE